MSLPHRPTHRTSTRATHDHDVHQGRRTWVPLATVAASLAVLAGCAGMGMGPMSPTPGARATLMDAAGKQVGTATFVDTAKGFDVMIDVRGLPPGEHGFHVHQNGQCAPGPDAATGQMVAFGAAGGHFDPMKTMKHGHPDAGAHEAHAGELPNLVVGTDGSARATFSNPRATVKSGPTSIIGRSLVIHANKDDYTTNPAGNSGPRIACGVIEAVAR